ncbi:hypothetical protein ABIB25_002422 [Nakamurella sp. UYEF19]|uniref:hypothetical protein n=1 Tax=Nakamurella sp. UYEF19 TaxID=1756392 RepID=UPI003390C3F5
MSDHSRAITRPRRFRPLLIIAGLAGAVVLSLSMTNTFSAFTASINNSVNTSASGTLILQEVNLAGGTGSTCNSTDGGTISTNASTCATINKYGGSTTMVPTNTGGTTSVSTTAITFKNTGTGIAQSFTLTPGACTQTPNGTPNGTATDFCAKLNVSIKSGTTVIFTGTAAALASGGAINVGALATVPAPNGAVVPITFAVTVDNSAGNTYQGLAASQPLLWTLSS